MDLNTPAPLGLPAHQQQRDPASSSAMEAVSSHAPAPSQSMFAGQDLNRNGHGTGMPGVGVMSPAILAAIHAENSLAEANAHGPARSMMGSSAPMLAPAPPAPAPPPPPPVRSQPAQIQQHPQALHPPQPAPAPAHVSTVTPAPAMTGTSTGPAAIAESEDHRDESRVDSGLTVGDQSMSFNFASTSAARPEPGSSEGTSRTLGKRPRPIDAPDENFAGPISVARNGGLFSTSFNPYAMPDLDVLASHWSAAARAALSGRVKGLMRFFRIAGYLPPPPQADDDPNRASRKKMRVMRGYESWKCRACGIVLNPVCGETGNARKHISLRKCGGLYAPLEAALMYDQDEEVRAALRGGDDEKSKTSSSSSGPAAQQQPESVAAASDAAARAAAFLVNRAAGSSGSSTSAAGGSMAAAPSGYIGATGPKTGVAASRSPYATPARKQTLLRNRQSEATSAAAKARAGSNTSASAPNPADISTASALSGPSTPAGPTPLYQQQPDGSVVLVGYNQTAVVPSASTPGGGSLGPSAIVLGPTLRAPSALAVASYFVAVGQPPEHADSLPWRYLFDGVPGMPTVQAIREAMRGPQP